jgi:hypothetical protein
LAPGGEHAAQCTRYNQKYLVSLPTSGAEPDIVMIGEASIWLQVENTKHALDPDPTVYPNADTVPDPDPSFQIKGQTLEKVLKHLVPLTSACSTCQREKV